MTAPPPRLDLGKSAAGLVVMLDAAGRTIAGLEDRVDTLVLLLEEERRQRGEVEALLAQLHADADTGHVTPSAADTPDDGPYDVPPPGH